MQKNLYRILKLSEASSESTVRILSGHHVSLAEGTTKSWVTITRTGSFTDPRYGRFEITKDMLLSMVRNFQANTYGQAIFIDLNHDPKGGAAGEVADLKVEGSRLRALVEWTDHGVDAIQKRKMIYLSAEFHDNYKDNEEGKEHGPTLFGAALTVRPVIKGLDRVQLSEGQTQERLYVHPDLIQSLAAEAIMNKYLKKLLAQWEAQGLSDAQIKTLSEAFTTSMGDSTDDAVAKALAESLGKVSKELSGTSAPITLSVQSGGGLDEAAVAKILAEHEQGKADAVRKLAEDKNAKVKLFASTLAKHEGIDEAVRKTLCESMEDIITANMDDASVVALAELQAKQTNEQAVAHQLSALGYNVGGTVHVSVDESNQVKSLQESIDKGTGMERKDVSPFVEKLLAEFDRRNGAALASEHKMLAGGATGIADTNLPAGYQRTVIREALSDLNILNLVNTVTDFGATITIGLPFETRDTSAVLSDGVVYEGQGIPGASVKQDMDFAYVQPMKLSLKVSNEVAFFSQSNGAVNWDAYARNVASNSRVIRELVARRIANEFQRSSDAFGAITRTDTLTAQVTGGASSIKTTYFPIVRPKQDRDLKGNAIGTEQNPIVVTLGGTVLAAFDGSGNQAAGTYYRVTSFNLGYIQFVDKAGAPVAPAAAALTVSYSEATNVTKFDLDSGAVAIEDHLNGLLRAVGARKALLTGDRFISPQNMFALMSPTLNDQVTNARAFVESQAREGTSLTGQGDLSTIKGIGSFGTNAPGIDLGDERILMGEAGLMGYGVSKVFQTGAPFEAVNAAGLPTGEKVAYGEEYNAIKLPTPLRNRLTSVLAYSAAGR